MKRLKRSVLAYVIVVLLLTVIPGTVTATTVSSNCGSWRVVSSPNAGLNSSVLNGVAAVSRNDIWAVGYSLTSSGQQTPVEHWSGKKWSIISNSTPGYLTAVTVVSARDIWAVGFHGSSSGQQTLIEHWNGTRWKVVSSPNIAGSRSNELDGVAAISAKNVWAVGFYLSSSGPPRQKLTEQWNGKKWHIVSSPNAGSVTNQLRGV